MRRFLYFLTCYKSQKSYARGPVPARGLCIPALKHHHSRRIFLQKRHLPPNCIDLISPTRQAFSKTQWIKEKHLEDNISPTG